MGPPPGTVVRSIKTQLCAVNGLHRHEANLEKVAVTIQDEKISLNGQEFRDLKKKSLAGMAALFIRQILIKVIFFAGNIALARMLAPQIFGVYAIVSFVVTFFSSFGDVGIGAALIQKKGELTREELSTTFWLQQMLVWIVVGIAFAAAPLALRIYPSLPPVGVWLIRAMAVSFLFSSLKTIPAILMERNIDFKRIAWVDITENVAFQAVAIVCALMGLEVWSFILAAITRSLLGALIIYNLSPWRPTFYCRLESVKGLVRFGLPYQGNQILSFIKDAVTPLFVGTYVGAAAVGYVNWARNFAFAPLMISETFGRVAFPAFSRLQDNKELLARTVGRSIKMMTLVMFPITAVMLAMGPELIHVVFTDKWMPAVNAYNFYTLAIGGIGISLPLYSGILSLGKSKILLIMTVCLIFLEWGMAVPFVIKYGYNGVALTQPVLMFMCICVYHQILRRYGINVKVIPNIAMQALAAVIAVVTVVLCKNYWNVNLLNTILLCGLGGLVYSGTMYLFSRQIIIDCLNYVRGSV
jgi:O-antigen/teichoic acid export membrane protein